MPVVSIVTAALNAEAYLSETIESVLAQDFGDWELLLVDDGSTDATAKIARAHAEADPRIQILRHPDGGNRGLSPSRNLALSAAKGAYVAFLDADDVWTETKLSDQLAILQANPSIGMVCGAVNYWSSWSGGHDELRHTAFVRDAVIPAPYMAIHAYPVGDHHAPTPSDLMLRTDTIRSVGGFEDSFVGPLTLYEDQAFLAKVYCTADVWVSSRCWLNYRQHPASMMRSEIRKGRYRQVRRHFFQWYQSRLSSLRFGDNLALRHAVARAASLEERPLRRLLWAVDRKLFSGTPGL